MQAPGMCTLSANFSSCYLAAKDVEKVNVCPSPLILAIFKSDTETKLVTWPPFLVRGEKRAYLWGKPSHLC